MKSPTLHCPYCHTELAFGVQRCVNCAAELEYGVPMFAYVGVVIVSITSGTIITNLLPSSLHWVDVPTMLIVAVGATLLARTIYRDHVEFRLPRFLS
ncbi:hypothetical protein [Burkholderia sp. BCC0405]|uniref:hypothetical protein n=1 Tax=Burkholderia sp. BCC0405 TaxID=2676298 RepID=UPI00158D0391|nr:hypothetical protein [Burkholderia sp. BCC0405]